MARQTLRTPHLYLQSKHDLCAKIDQSQYEIRNKSSRFDYALKEA